MTLWQYKESIIFQAHYKKQKRKKDQKNEENKAVKEILLFMPKAFLRK